MQDSSKPPENGHRGRLVVAAALVLVLLLCLMGMAYTSISPQEPVSVRARTH